MKKIKKECCLSLRTVKISIRARRAII